MISFDVVSFSELLLRTSTLNFLYFPLGTHVVYRRQWLNVNQPNMGGINNMAHDRMNDDLDRNMGQAGQKDDQDFGQQTPGRNPQQDQQGGQKGAGQKNPVEDDEFGGGQSGQKGSPGRSGGQNQ
jgi:hypothetical protein